MPRPIQRRLPLVAIFLSFRVIWGGGGHPPPRPCEGGSDPRPCVGYSCTSGGDSRKPFLLVKIGGTWRYCDVTHGWPIMTWDLIFFYTRCGIVARRGMASFKTKFLVLQELFTKNHRGRGCTNPNPLSGRSLYPPSAPACHQPVWVLPKPLSFAGLGDGALPPPPGASVTGRPSTALWGREPV